MNNVELTVIGCGDAFGSGARSHACFYVKAPHCGLLLDCGASAIPGLKKYGISIHDIDTVLITSFHTGEYC